MSTLSVLLANPGEEKLKDTEHVQNSNKNPESWKRQRISWAGVNFLVVSYSEHLYVVLVKKLHVTAKLQIMLHVLLGKMRLRQKVEAAA